ncbi:MAG: toxin-antitoxin system YwqK family antitoxin [Calditrichia bacterium]
MRHFILFSLMLALTVVLSSCESSEPMTDLTKMIEHAGLHYAPEQTPPYTGVAASFYHNEQMRKRVVYLNGKEHGPTASWYESGQLQSEGRYTEGTSDSLWRWYDKDGNKRVEVVFDHGKKTGIETQWYPNGQEKFITTYSDEGKQTGTHKGWYENGQLKFVTSYVDGFRDSLYVAWFENGQKRSQANYVKGDIVGTVMQWHEDGRVKSKWEYEDGKPVHNANAN